MYRTLMLVAVTAMIGGNLLTAQAAQESGFQDRTVNTLRSNVDIETQGLHLPPIVQAPKAATIQAAPAQRWTRQQSGYVQSNRGSEAYRNNYVPATGRSKTFQNSSGFQPRQNYHRVPEQAFQKSSRKTKARSYAPPILKDVIPVRETPVRRQVVETRESKAEQDYQFAPRPPSDSFSYRRQEYSQQNETPSVTRQDTEKLSRRILQLRSKPTAQQSDLENESALLAAKRVLENSELSQTRETTPQPFPPKPDISNPFADPPSNEWNKLQEIESNIVETPDFPAPLPERDLVESNNDWAQPKPQFSDVESPEKQVVETPLFKEPSSFVPPANSLPEVSQDRTSNTFQGALDNSVEPALPTQPESNFEKSVAVNDFSPQPKVKSQPNNLFLPPMPSKAMAGRTIEPFGSPEKQPVFSSAQTELPVPALKTPDVSLRVAANSVRPTSEASGWWWLYLLPIIPLLLIGWFLLRNSFDGAAEQEYYEPMPPAKPRKRQYPAGITGEKTTGFEIPTEAPTNSGLATAGAMFEGTSLPSPPPVAHVKETVHVPPATSVSSDLQVLREEDIEVLEDIEVCDIDFDGTEVCCSANEPTANCQDRSEAVPGERWKKSEARRKLDEKSTEGQSRPLNLVPLKEGTAPSSKAEEAKASAPEAELETESSSQIDRRKRRSKTSDKTNIRAAAERTAAQRKWPPTNANGKSAAKRNITVGHSARTKSTQFKTVDKKSNHATEQKSALRRAGRNVEIPKLPAPTTSSVTAKSNSENSSASAAGGTGAPTVVDLTKIRGISPEVAKVLRINGINSYGKIVEAGPDKLKQILKTGGAKFQRINPTQWPEQAALAAKGDWDGLVRWQARSKELSNLRTTKSGLEKKTVHQRNKRKAKTLESKSSVSDKEDLTKISGVGAATQRFLNKKGIFSFSQIASMDSRQLQEVFKSGERRFQLLNTETWAEQAKAILKTKAEESQPDRDSGNENSTANILNLKSTVSSSTSQQFSS